MVRWRRSPSTGRSGDRAPDQRARRRRAPEAPAGDPHDRGSKRVEFGYLKEALELTGGNLSRHLTVLVDAGLLDMEKGYDGKRPKTWVSITRAGRKAFADEIAALRALVDRHGV
ncbi:transcriptional regulator [Actinophytocola sp.]|uniref:transcriptional regulator n=1 Tax=Actinophytocola sp. TaxID=1872138 RepID=UPI0025BE41D6|nr:transcriptional regulator [Actinophytocola sp.]